MTQPSQVFPPWLTPSVSTVTNAAGVPVATETTIVYVPLTYFGPSVSIGNFQKKDRSWRCFLILFLGRYHWGHYGHLVDPPHLLQVRHQWRLPHSRQLRYLLLRQQQRHLFYLPLLQFQYLTLRHLYSLPLLQAYLYHRPPLRLLPLLHLLHPPLHHPQPNSAP